MMIFTHKSVKMTRANCMIFAIDVESDLYNWDPIQFILVLVLWVFTLVGEKLHLLVKNYTLKCKITFTFYVYFQYKHYQKEGIFQIKTIKGIIKLVKSKMLINVISTDLWHIALFDIDIRKLDTMHLFAKWIKLLDCVYMYNIQLL